MAMPVIDVHDIFRRVLWWLRWAVLNPVVGWAAMTAACIAAFSTLRSALGFNIPGVDIGTINMFLINNSLYSLICYAVAGDVLVGIFDYIITVANWLINTIPSALIALFIARLVYGKLALLRAATDDVIRHL